jgi:hypothetical protein
MRTMVLICGAVIPAQTESSDLHAPYLCSLPFLEVLTAHWGLFQCMHVCAACLSAGMHDGLDLLAGTRLKINILVVMFIYRDPFIFDCHLAYFLLVCIYVCR